MLITDSREKKNAHILAYFDRHNIEYEVRKLDVGDYMFEGGAISVDTKRSISELASNLTNPADKSRFWNEVRRGYQSGIKLVILVESNIYHEVTDLKTWKSKYNRVNGYVLIKEIGKLKSAYGVDFLFAPKVSTGRRIIEILSCNQQE